MKKLLRAVARLYPAAWRDRYGVEFQALLDEMTPEWRDMLDVLNGGLQMRLRRAHPALTVAVLGILGALGAGVVAFSTASRFTSTGTMTVRPGGPLTVSETTRLEEDVMPKLARAAFSGDFLTGIVQRHDLYPGERAQASAEELIDRVRGDIRVQLVSRSVVQVSFASADARQAQAVTSDLISQLVTANLTAGNGSTVQVIDPPDEPRVSVNPRYVGVAGLGGLSGGALIGTLIGLRPRRRSRI